MRDGVRVAPHPIYVPDRPAIFDTVVCLGDERRTVEEWWWRTRADEVDDRRALARAIVDTVGVEASFQLRDLSAWPSYEARFRELYQLGSGSSKYGLASDVWRLIEKEHASEGKGVVEGLISAWFSQPEEDRWFGEGLTLAQLAAFFGVLSGEIISSLPALFAALHEAPPRPTTLDLVLASAMLLLEDDERDRVWLAIAAMRSESREDFLTRVGPKVAHIVEAMHRLMAESKPSLGG